MKLFVIGDIHGCADELEELLKQTDAHIKEGDKYVFLGDYIDRGPKVKETIEILVERKKNHPNEHIFLKGNHEDMMLQNDAVWDYNGGYTTTRSYNADKTFSLMSQLVKEHKDFFSDLKLYHKEKDIVCVHAGLDPSLPVDEQHEQTMLWTRRFNTYDGPYYDGYLVVYGHTPVEVINFKTNQIGIDTGCVFGGSLTCIVLDVDTRSYDSYFQVKSNFDFMAGKILF